jgi:hypothetical protein
VSCRLSFPSLQCRSLFLIGVCTSRQGTDTLLWCPSHCNVAVTEVHMPPTYTHPPPLPFLSALSTPNTKDQHLFLLLRRNHSFRRIQDSWPPGPFRCPVCVCACLPVFMCVLVDLFCPPPTTTTTVLPIPHSVCPSSPCFAKIVSSGNVCGNVHKTASVGGHAHGRERKSGMGVTFLLSHCRKGVEWCVNRREIVGLVGIAELD